MGLGVWYVVLGFLVGVGGFCRCAWELWSGRFGFLVGGFWIGRWGCGFDRWGLNLLYVGLVFFGRRGWGFGR